MKTHSRTSLFMATILLGLTSAAHLSAAPQPNQSSGKTNNRGIQHVLLISIDGMHALD
jgi:hypothetical protein